MRQIALKKKVGALLGKTHLPPATPVFDDWSQIEWWRRWLLPANFRSQVALSQEEILECRQLVTEYLFLKESRKFAILRVSEARAYPQDMDCHPREFRNQRIKLIEGEEEFQCNRCKGKGKSDCSPEVRCPNCKGRRTRIDHCFTCGGSGRAGQDQKEQCWSCRGRGTRSEDCAACATIFTGSTGRVRCNRCGGTGWVVCRACNGAGVKTRATLVTRRYTCSAESHFRLGNLGEDCFKNGLEARHIKSLAGDLVHREVQAPDDATVTLQRLSEFSYGVTLRAYRYRGAEFYLNRIYSGNGARTVARNMPWSWSKAATAGILGALALAALATALLVS